MLKIRRGAFWSARGKMADMAVTKEEQVNCLSEQTEIQVPSLWLLDR